MGMGMSVRGLLDSCRGSRPKVLAEPELHYIIGGRYRIGVHMRTVSPITTISIEVPYAWFRVVEGNAVSTIHVTPKFI